MCCYFIYWKNWFETNYIEIKQIAYKLKLHRKSVKKIDLGLLILLCDSNFMKFFEEGYLYCQSEL